MMNFSLDLSKESGTGERKIQSQFHVGVVILRGENWTRQEETELEMRK